MRSLHSAMKSSPRSPQLEKATHSNEAPTQPKINKIKKKNKEFQWTHNVWELSGIKQVRGKWLLTAQRGHTFHENQNLL